MSQAIIKDYYEGVNRQGRDRMMRSNLILDVVDDKVYIHKDRWYGKYGEQSFTPEELAMMLHILRNKDKAPYKGTFEKLQIIHRMST